MFIMVSIYHTMHGSREYLDPHKALERLNPGLLLLSGGVHYHLTISRDRVYADVVRKSRVR